MKSIGIRKLAALAGGAALLGAALAGAQAPVIDEAGLGMYEFIRAGVPQVKIAVGAKAAASDGIAAGNIAAMLANLAYTTQDVTITGKEAVTCVGAGAAECINKSVTLDVTVPGVVPVAPGEALLKHYIADYLDKDIAYNFTRGQGPALEVVDAAFPGLGLKKTVTDKVAAKTYVQQDKYTFPTGTLNYYDTSTDYKQWVGRVPSGSRYEIMFETPIPYHTATTNATFVTDPDAYLTERHGVELEFLGSKYLISKFEGPSTTTPSAPLTKLVLGAGAALQVLKVGQSITVADKTIKLVAITEATGPQALRGAIIDITDAVGTERVTVGPTGPGVPWLSTATKKGITVSAPEVVSAGVESYAKVNAFSAALEIPASGTMNFVGDAAKTNANMNWSATLLYENVTLADGKNVTALRGIRLVGPSVSRLKAGESYKFVTDPVFASLTFVGPETPTEFDTLAIGNPIYSTAVESLRPPGLYYVLSSAGNNFEVTGAYGPKLTDKIYYQVLNDSWVHSSNVAYYWDVTNGTYVQLTGLPVYKYPTNPTSATSINLTLVNSTGAEFPFGTPVANVGYGRFRIYEDQKEESPTPTESGTFTINVNASALSGYQVLLLPSTAPNTLSYASATTFSDIPGTSGNFEAGYITPRGSKIESISTTEAKIKYAKKTAKMQWKFSLAAPTAPIAPGVERKTLLAGENFTKDGYVVKVVEIGGTVPPVAPGVVQGLDALAASPAKAAVVTELAPQTSPLVITDTEATGVAKVIAVGGHLVNTVTAAIPGASDAIKEGQPPIVKVFGDKIVVAGWTAEGTTSAAKALITWLSERRAAITGG